MCAETQKNTVSGQIISIILLLNFGKNEEVENNFGNVLSKITKELY